MSEVMVSFCATPMKGGPFFANGAALGRVVVQSGSHDEMKHEAIRKLLLSETIWAPCSLRLVSTDCEMDLAFDVLDSKVVLLAEAPCEGRAS